MFKKKGTKNKENEDNCKESLKEKFADILDTSKEIILNTTKITVIGNKDAMVENYKAITEYTETVIKIMNDSNTVQIKGKKLEMKTITKDLIYITGLIKSIEFLM